MTRVAGIRRWAVLALALLTVALMSGPNSPNESQAAWVTYQGDAAHTGYVGGRYHFRRAKLRWQTAVTTKPLDGIAIGGSTVFVTAFSYFSNDEAVWALDQATGSVLWSKAFGSGYESASPPAYVNGVVYLQNYRYSPYSSGFLNAYDARTGTTIFNAPYYEQGQVYLSPTPFGGNIFIGGGYFGGMRAFSVVDGTEKWFGIVPDYEEWTPAVDRGYAYAYTGSGSTYPINGVFTMLNVCDGTSAATIVPELTGLAEART